MFRLAFVIWLQGVGGEAEAREVMAENMSPTVIQHIFDALATHIQSADPPLHLQHTNLLEYDSLLEQYEKLKGLKCVAVQDLVLAKSQVHELEAQISCERKKHKTDMDKCRAE
ncbi:hypothetical protein C8J57DRAFT_1391455, partial [Mycena rebaudengoi]